jgi:hypothetical protein
MSRFTKVAKCSICEVNEKTAVIIELQEGKEDGLPELVIAEMYKNKEGEWAYCKGGVRMDVTADNVNYILKGCKAMYEASKEVVKTKKEKSPKADPKKAVEMMSDEEKAALLEILLGSAKKTEEVKTDTKKSASTKKSSEPEELVLEYKIASGTKKK